MIVSIIQLLEEPKWLPLVRMDIKFLQIPLLINAGERYSSHSLLRHFN